MAAIRELWVTGKALGGDSRITDMTTDLMHDLAIKHNFHADQFANSTDTTSSSISSLTSDTVSATSGNQKYNNVKRRRRQQQTGEPYRFVFADLIQEDPTFRPMLDKSMVEISKQTLSCITSNNGTFLYPASYYVYNARKEEMKIKKSVRANAN